MKRTLGTYGKIHKDITLMSLVFLKEMGKSAVMKKITEEIMAESVPNLVKNTNLQQRFNITVKLKQDKSTEIHLL